jgi:hypothetical protein
VVYFHIARPAVGILLGHGAEGAPEHVARAYTAHAAEFAIAALTLPVARGGGSRPGGASRAPAKPAAKRAAKHTRTKVDSRKRST